ncbi:MAG: Uncharacterised protein [Rhodospirillaceae bacterium]|nr:MAG: Uncharacterised protein [Rhodospirillaceae bacterium]
MATGGDQIELSPPKMPEQSPTPICQTGAAVTGNFTPDNNCRENITIAKPIDTVSKAVGKLFI